MCIIVIVTASDKPYRERYRRHPMTTTPTQTILATAAPRPLTLAEIGQRKAEAYSAVQALWRAFAEIIDARETYATDEAYWSALDTAEGKAREAGHVYEAWCYAEDYTKAEALGMTEPPECGCVLPEQTCPACRAAAAHVGQPDSGWVKIDLEVEF